MISPSLPASGLAHSPLNGTSDRRFSVIPQPFSLFHGTQSSEARCQDMTSALFTAAPFAAGADGAPVHDCPVHGRRGQPASWHQLGRVASSPSEDEGRTSTTGLEIISDELKTLLSDIFSPATRRPAETLCGGYGGLRLPRIAASRTARIVLIAMAPADVIPVRGVVVIEAT